MNKQNNRKLKLPKRGMPYKYDFPLFFCCIVLSLIGVVFIGSAKITSSSSVIRDVSFSVIKQVLFLSIALFTMWFFSHVYRFETFRRFIPTGIVFIGGLLLLCLFSPARNGTKAWIPIPFIGSTIQPSEFAKTMMMLVVARYCCYPKKSADTFWKIIMPPLLVLLAYFIIICFLQKDLGSAAILVVISLSCFMLTTHPLFKKWQKRLYVCIFIGIFGVIFLLSPLGIECIKHAPIDEYKINRFIVSVEPFSDRHGMGFQVSNSLIAFARGGLIGQGLGSSVQKFGYLPYADSDFIIAVIAEEGGLLMLTVVFALYGIILWRLLRYALRVKKEENKVMLFGTAMYLFVHIIFNVGGATAFIPLTGVPLLMLSSGGTSIVSWYLAVGICQAIIARYRRGEE
ncbi:MAG: FtsW/RodA/SpoVE family cell cycle protein [Erysipelotrichaceae bacterium]|nr:FtsW/RodA/SpoVE family cell cycle protein [Erysipelotrichaceae bacterium]